MFTLNTLFTIVLVASFVSHQVAANWDPATGHLRDFKPIDSWIASNEPNRVTKAIQVAECAINTRLAFPNVQLFAWFSVNHTCCDNYHGCPYGTCFAYTVFPQPNEFEVDFTSAHSFFWHQTGGIPGTGTNPIANPQTGGFGYESSLDGVYHDGKANTATMQVGHDDNYPNIDFTSLPKWSQQARDKYVSLVAVTTVPTQPKCGRPDEPNKDPGAVPGAFGNYHPRPASDYQAPLGYVPSPPGHNDTQPVVPPDNQTQPVVPPDNQTQPVVPPDNQTQPFVPPHNQTHPKHHGHHGQGPGPTPRPTHGHCRVFCECIGGCSQADESCHATCQAKHLSCSAPICQQESTSPVLMSKRHAHKSSHH